MRLPNFDLTLLAAHYLFAAADGRAHSPVALPQPRRFAERIDAALPLLLPLANATRAGLIDFPAPALAHVVRHTPAAAHVVRHAPAAVHVVRRARASTPLRRTPRALARARRQTPETGLATPPRASRATLAKWSHTWDALPACQKAELAQAIAAAQRAGDDIDAYVTARSAASRAATRQWLMHPLAPSSADAHGPADADADATTAAAAETDSAADAARRAQESDTVAFYRRIQKNTTLTLHDAIAITQRLAGTRRVQPSLLAAVPPSAAPRTADPLYQADCLADFFHLPALCRPPRTELGLLREVHAVLGTLFPEYRAMLLDEHAIAVAARLWRRCTEAPPDPLKRASATATHGDFHDKVSAELTAQARAAPLLPWSDTPPADGRAWFDGIAVRDAANKTVDDLVDDLFRLRPSLAARLRLPTDDAPPNSASASASASDRSAASHYDAAPAGRPLLGQWMKKRLADLVESVRFPFGTPAQSIDTILLRLSGMQGVEHAPGDDFTTVLRDFTRLCAAWQARPGYWVSPTLAAALHLVHASGTHAAVDRLDPTDRENHLIDVFHERLQAYRSAPEHDANAVAPGASAAAASPDFKAAFLATAESWLALPRWPMSVGRTLVRGEPREILSLVPFVVPAYDIEEGVRLGNASRAMRGAFQFGADVLMTWVGGRIDASLAVQDALPALEQEGRAALAMLHHGAATLGETHPKHLPLTGRTPLEPAHGVVTLTEDGTVPLQHRHLAARARGGEIVPIRLRNVPNARLVHLPRERRVIPVGLAGATVWELDWEGHIVGVVEARRLGDLREALLAETRVSNTPETPDTPGAPDPHANPPQRAAQWPAPDGRTVESMERWLALADPAPSRHPPPIQQADDALRGVLDFDEEDPEELAMFAELRAAYCRSATFRLMMQSITARADGRRLEFTIEPGATPHYTPAHHVITVPPADEIASIDYLGWHGPTRFDARDVWIHEFIHAMTRMSDPEPSLAALHRGPVVYLTDRILYEMNRRSPERIAYMRPQVTHGGATIEPSPRVMDRVIRENILLDEQLALRTATGPRTPILGIAAMERATVRAALLIETLVRTAVSRPAEPSPFVNRLLDAVRVDVLDTHLPPGPHLRLARDFVRHAQAIYEGSAWARGFLDAWLRRETPQKWTLRQRAPLGVMQDALPYRVQTDQHRIELSFADVFAYLCPTGLQPYTMRRRVASLLSELAIPARARTSTIDAELERGAVVYAENKLLGLSRDGDERRVAARIWHRQETPRPFPTVNPTLARRVAEDEDRVLASVCPSVPHGSYACSA
ncbi:MAG: PipA/GogA/GtgA family type III secretion system effector [Janthinobacterium lividum]